MAQQGEHDDAGEERPYQVVARRFRPHTFAEMVGQDDVLHSLRSALSQHRVPHAFLFSGSRGVGKTTSARILARCLNCEQGPTPEPCGECAACRSILDGSNPDVLELDAASNNGVAEVRQLRESVGFATMQSRYRVVILDEVHMLSKSAFNAFLKTLEEPPPNVVFVLATTELHKVPDTIRSRCQVLLFRRVGETDLVRRLRTIADKEGLALPDDVLNEIAQSVQGGVRDAETALERILPLARELGDKFDLEAYRALTARVGSDAVVDVVAGLLQGDARKGLHFAQDLEQRGADEREALGEIVDALRWLMLLKIDGDDSGLVPVSGQLRERMVALAKTAEPPQLDAMLGAGLLGRDRLRRLEDRGAVFEVALVRMAQAAALPTLANLLAEARAGGFAGGGGGGGAPAPRQAAGGGGAPLRPSHAAPAAPAAPPRPVAPAANANDLKARVLAHLNDRKLLQATAELCRVEGPDDKGRVVVTLETERKMHRDRLNSQTVRTELIQAFITAAGREITVDIRVPDEPAAGTPGQPKPPLFKAEPGPRTQGVMKRFGGRVVQVDPPDRIKKDAPPAGDAADDANYDGGGEMLDPGEPPSD
ncbi:MAG: DNA polymerase III subunit gamma/tau [Planctomycetes bacterium]|nr:DNA polymerase III subunit gamma/tau [Planctomycetota bacterium]